MSATVVALGNLGRDPETRAAGQSEVCSFSIAVNRRARGGEKETDWYQVSVWGKNGQNCQRYLKKGSKVLVTGQLAQRDYTTSGGEERTSLDINANDVTFLDPPPESGASSGAQSGQRSAPPADEDIPF